MSLILSFVLITGVAPPSAAPASTLGELEHAMESTKEKVRARAALLLGAVAGSESTGLLESAAENDPSVLVRLACVEAMLNRRSARGLPALFRVGALDQARAVRALVAERLPALIDSKSLPFIRRAFEERDPRVRALIMRTLPVPLPESFYALLVRAHADYPEVRSAAFARAMLLDDSVRWSLFEQIARSVQEDAARGMAEELGHVDDHRVVPILLMVFDRGESSPELRRAAVTALSHARRHLPLRELLAQARESTHSHVRMRALKLLETIGGESVIETMMAVLEDPELPVRATAAMVLARLGHRGAVSKLETMALDPVNQRIVGHLERALEILRMGTQMSEERR